MFPIICLFNPNDAKLRLPQLKNSAHKPHLLAWNIPVTAPVSNLSVLYVDEFRYCLPKDDTQKSNKM
jgi:hypothetical protein